MTITRKVTQLNPSMLNKRYTLYSQNTNNEPSSEPLLHKMLFLDSICQYVFLKINIVFELWFLKQIWRFCRDIHSIVCVPLFMMIRCILLLSEFRWTARAAMSHFTPAFVIINIVLLHGTLYYNAVKNCCSCKILCWKGLDFLNIII